MLPPRPLGIRSRALIGLPVGAFFLVLLGLGVAAAVAYWQVPQALAIGEDKRIWREGQPAGDVMVRGTDRSRQFIFHEYDLTVEYTAADGIPRNVEIEYDTLGSLDHEDRAPEVKVDPRDPRRIAVNWAVEATGRRWGHIAVIAGFLGLMAIVSIVGGVSLIRRLGAIRTAARVGEELHLEVVEAVVQYHNGTETGTRYKLRLPPDPPWNGREVTQTMRKKGRPMMTQEGRVVALVAGNDPGHPILVETDGYPFVI